MQRLLQASFRHCSHVGKRHYLAAASWSLHGSRRSYSSSSSAVPLHQGQIGDEQDKESLFQQDNNALAVIDSTNASKKRAKLKALASRKVTKKEKNKMKNPFLELPLYKIPILVKSELDDGVFPKNLRRFSHKTLQGYEHYWRCLLWAAEWQDTKNLERYDMDNAQLAPFVEAPENDQGPLELGNEATKRKNNNQWILEVPGLEEGRPSVMSHDRVVLTWNGKTFGGTVVDTELDRIRITTAYHPFVEAFDHVSDRVHVRFLPSSRMTYRLGHNGIMIAAERMQRAMLVPTKANSRAVLKSMERRQVTPIQTEISWANGNLNDEQKQAVCEVLQGTCRPLPYIILGPPGTGKTATVAETVLQWVCHNPDGRILTVAPSNDAADVLLAKLSQHLKPREMTRILSHRRIDQIPDSLLDYVHLNTSEFEKTKQRIMESRVTVATVNTAARFSFYGIDRGFFETIIVDEAGYATEPEVIAVASSLLDFDRGGRLVLAGDPKQLGPVVMNKECQRLGLDTSYMERLTRYSMFKKQKSSGEFFPGLVTMLRRNYRSHESIIRLPNEMFYDGELTCHADPATSHNMCQWAQLPRKDFPVFFHAITGENLREDTSPSWFNPQEASLCVEYAQSLVASAGLSSEDVGIITPYIAQVSKIRQALKALGLAGIKVGSVETFQGQERRAIIMSTVRSERDHVATDIRYNLGFVANSKRFNVSLTRAKSLLIVVGCPDVLSLDKKNWLPFLRYCYEQGGWKGQEWDPTLEKSSPITKSEEPGDQVLDVSSEQDVEEEFAEENISEP